MELMVKAICRAASRVIELELVDPQGEPLPEWQPGAHLDLVLGNGLVRQYSLCSDPADRHRYQVAVLQQDASRGGSEWLHSELREGGLLEIRGPKNHFALEDGPRYLFVAGGIGITPLLPMVAAVAAFGKPFKVLYGGRSLPAMAYLDRLRVYGDAVAVVPEDENGRLDLDSFLGQPEQGTLVYCCGPEPLLQAVEDRCAARPELILHFERFAVAPDATPVTPREGDQPFEVHLEQSEKTLHVGPRETLLDVLESAGADIYSDCQEGICGTCEVQVVEGVIDHRDSVLSAGEKASGKVMMACVSRAACPRLVLDL